MPNIDESIINEQYTKFLYGYIPLSFAIFLG